MFRGVTLAANFLFVLLTFRFLNLGWYGIWLTLNSIVGWVSMLDIGIGKELLNTYAESLA